MLIWIDNEQWVPSWTIISVGIVSAFTMKNYLQQPFEVSFVVSLLLMNWSYFKILQSLCEKCPNTEFFWSVFPRIWTEYGDIYAVNFCIQSEYEKIRTRKNSVFGHFLHSDLQLYIIFILPKKDKTKLKY